LHKVTELQEPGTSPPFPANKAQEIGGTGCCTVSVFQLTAASPVKSPKSPQPTKTSLTQGGGMENTTKTKANMTS